VVSFDVAFMRGEISGTIRVKEGTVTLLESDRGTHLIVELHIDMRSLNTGSGLLDGILRSLLKVETHPTALFNGEALDALPGRHPRDETVHIDLPARLTLAEETVSHTVDTEAVLHERRMQLTAAFTVRFEELDARPPPLVGDAISFEVMLTTR
jgi:polyisoprenoid-binding protein YceI